MIRFQYEYTDERWARDAKRPDEVVTMELATDPGLIDTIDGGQGLLSRFRSFLLAIGYPVRGDLMFIDESVETVVDNEELNALYRAAGEMEEEEDDRLPGE